MSKINADLPIPTIPGNGFSGLMSARMRALITFGDLSLEQLQEATEIEAHEFRAYFANTESWTTCDLERVAEALEVDLFDLFSCTPAPIEMRVSELIVWFWCHYDVHCRASDVIDMIVANVDLSPFEQWCAVVERADRIAVESVYTLGGGAA
ncbi:hypothetical protein OG563_05980 [Nocardia vinacea]|uniref:HTH cro/C1-type domain-containing protein n=1 Tax=Nocardia vinacea TaxID=96468 RepID=A0ABZ1YXN2_9NOCA|nr:hypothetical protein [Nocardia vinacea]